jgi:hypothetical protein
LPPQQPPKRFAAVRSGVKFTKAAVSSHKDYLRRFFYAIFKDFTLAKS